MGILKIKKIKSKDVIYNKNGNNNVEEALDDLYTKSSIIDGEVDYYSDLPTPIEHIEETWLVEKYSILTPIKLTGLYYCNGVSWDRRSDKVIYSLESFSGVNKLVKTNDTNRQIIETAIEIDSSNNLDLKSGGLKDVNVINAIKLGDINNIELTTGNKTIIGGLNELSTRTRGGSSSPLPVYLTTDNSTINPLYKQLNYSLPSTQTILNTIVNNNEVLINSYLFDFPIDTTEIPAGLWSLNFYGYVSSAVGTTKIRLEVFKRSSVGVETTLFSVESGEINSLSSVDLIRIETFQNSILIDNTDYIGGRLYANTTALINITISTYIGNVNPTYFTTPLELRHDLLRDIKFISDNKSGALHLTNGSDDIYGSKTFKDDVEIKGKTTSFLEIKNKTDNHTLELTDTSSVIELDSTLAKTITIPLESNVNFALGTIIGIIQKGDGQVSIIGDVGVNIFTSKTLNLKQKYSVVSLLKNGADSWYLFGDLEE